MYQTKRKQSICKHNTLEMFGNAENLVSTRFEIDTVILHQGPTNQTLIDGGIVFLNPLLR